MKRQQKIFWLVSLLSFGISISSSILTLKLISERIPIFGSAVGLQRSLNSGIAFGMDLGVLQPILIGIALIFVLWTALLNTSSNLEKIAFGLIIGGGSSNIIDRIYDGYVTDIFQVGSFPIFNVADTCITVGVGLLMLNYLVNKKNF